MCTGPTNRDCTQCEVGWAQEDSACVGEAAGQAWPSPLPPLHPVPALPCGVCAVPSWGAPVDTRPLWLGTHGEGDSGFPRDVLMSWHEGLGYTHIQHAAFRTDPCGFLQPSTAGTLGWECGLFTLAVGGPGWSCWLRPWLHKGDRCGGQQLGWCRLGGGGHGL